MSPHFDMTLRRLTQTLPRFAYRFKDENELQQGIATVLTEAGFDFQREFIAGPQDRFDFLVAPGIVVESKIHGSMGKAGSQVLRYAKRDDVAAVVLVTTKIWGNSRMQESLHGKPVRMVYLRGSAF